MLSARKADVLCRRLRLAKAAPQGSDDAGGAVRFYARTVRSTHAAATSTAKAVMMSYGMVRLLYGEIAPGAPPMGLSVAGQPRTVYSLEVPGSALPH